MGKQPGAPKGKKIENDGQEKKSKWGKVVVGRWNWESSISGIPGPKRRRKILAEKKSGLHQRASGEWGPRDRKKGPPFRPCGVAAAAAATAQKISKASPGQTREKGRARRKVYFRTELTLPKHLDGKLKKNALSNALGKKLVEDLSFPGVFLSKTYSIFDFTNRFLREMRGREFFLPQVKKRGRRRKEARRRPKPNQEDWNSSVPRNTLGFGEANGPKP